MAFCERLSEQLAVVGTIDPTATLAALGSVDQIDMSLHRRCLFVLMVGATNVGPGILVNVQEGTVAAPAAAVILTRAAADTAATASQYVFEVSAEAMGAGYTHLRFDITPSGASTVAVLALADVERYSPGSDRDLASVVSIQAAN